MSSGHPTQCSCRTGASTTIKLRRGQSVWDQALAGPHRHALDSRAGGSATVVKRSEREIGQRVVAMSPYVA